MGILLARRRRAVRFRDEHRALVGGARRGLGMGIGVEIICYKHADKAYSTASSGKALKYVLFSFFPLFMGIFNAG
jgi:hypothetical protein